MKGILIAAGMTAASIAFGMMWGNAARAHDIYTGLKNPHNGQLCCDERDCRPVDQREIGEDGPDYTWRGSKFPKRQSQPSPDGRYHVCSYPSWQLNGTSTEVIRCLLRPQPGA